MMYLSDPLVRWFLASSVFAMVVFIAVINECGEE